MTFKNRRKNTFKLYKEVREDLQMNDSYSYFTYCVFYLFVIGILYSGFKIDLDRTKQNKTK